MRTHEHADNGWRHLKAVALVGTADDPRKKSIKPGFIPSLSLSIGEPANQNHHPSSHPASWLEHALTI